MSIAIKAENLGKKYILNKYSKAGGYTALRDVLASKVQNVFKTDPLNSKKEDFWALQNLNFEIKQGDRVGIIGRNGAGKSTLLKILSRITEPTTGKISLKGRVTSLLEVGTGFHPELTGRENIFINGAILGMGRNEIKNRFDEIVAFSEVEKFLDTPVKRYSSGMYVRLAFSIAAHLESEILVVDEVLAVGDAQFQKKCLGKMEGIGNSGKTVLFVSHNMAVINKICDRSIFLSKGQIKHDGSTSEAISKYLSVDDTEVVPVKEISPSQRNRGGDTIKFKSCQLQNSLGESVNSFFIGEEIKVKIAFDSSEKNLISFWLIIFDAQGIPLLSSHQRDREALMEVKPGRYEIQYTTQDLGLMPGNYYITAGAFDKDLAFLEWIDSCQEFEIAQNFIQGKPFDGRWGLVDQKAIWRLSENS